MTTYNDIASIVPYFDDYNAAKNYLQLLFNPGRNVQARELTQIQTVLQNQVSSFASHVFRNNSVVVNTNLTYNTDYRVMTIEYDTLGSVITDATKSEIVAAIRANNIVEKVASSIECTSTHIQTTDDPTIFKVYFQYSTGGAFAVNDTIRFKNNTDLDFSVTAIDFAMTAACDGGIVYTEGRFAVVNPQSIIVDSAIDGEYHIGFERFEYVTASGDDSTLLDPAAGFSNASSPGADRYTLSMELRAYTTSVDSTQDYTVYETATNKEYDLLVSSNLPISADDASQVGYDSRRADPVSGHDFVENFAEYLVIKDRKIAKSTDKVDYSEILNVLARRTYDESGNYSLGDLKLNIEAHPTDSTKLVANMLPGKSYVHGYEIDIKNTISTELNKARDSYTQNAYGAYLSYGQYVVLGYDDFNKRLSADGSFIDFGVCETVEFVSSTGAVLSEAKATGAKKVNDNVRLYITDITAASGIASAVRVRSKATPTNFVDLKLVNGAAELRGTANSPIVEFPFDVVKSLSAGDTTYKFSKIYQTTLVDNAGTIEGTITGAAGVQFPSNSITSIRTLDAVTGREVSIAADLISTNYAGVTSIVVGRAADAGFGWEAGKDIQITVEAVRTNISFRNKTRHNSHNAYLVISGADDSATIYYPTTGTTVATRDSGKNNHIDGIRIVDAQQQNNNNSSLSSAEILPLFQQAFNGGQEDYFYNYIKFENLDLTTLRSGMTNDTLETYYVISYDYYEHDSNANNKAFAVSSYSDFEDIQTYTTAKGTKSYNLTNCLDFRVSVDQLTAAEFPLSETIVNSDVEYYVPRIDKVYLSTAGELGVIEGISSLNPTAPDDIANTMSTHVVRLGPYTYTKKEVSKTPIPNRRYTMKDIGEIERRLEAVEEYSALNLLEKKATDLLIVDQNGFDKFKSGIFVDSFYSYDTHNIKNKNYRMIIDTLSGTGHTPFTTSFFDMEFDQSSYSNIVLHENTATLDYTEETLVENTYCSDVINLQPYLFYQWNGFVKLSPNVDNWFDENRAPNILDNRTNTTIVEIPATSTTEPTGFPNALPAQPEQPVSPPVEELVDVPVLSFPRTEVSVIQSRWSGITLTTVPTLDLK